MRGIRKTATLGTILVGVLLAVFSLLNFMFMPKAHALATYKWVDASTIHVTGITIGLQQNASFDFVDSNPSDTSFEFSLATAHTACKRPKILVNPDNKGEGVFYNYLTPGGGPLEGPCGEIEQNVTIGDLQNIDGGITPIGENDYRNVTYTWSNENTIKATGTLSADFVKDSNRYFRTNDPTAENTCKDNISVDPKDPSKGVLRIMEPSRGNCNESTRNVAIANTAAGPGASEAGEDAETACSLAVGTSVGGKSVGWFVCAFSDGVAQVVDVIDNLINSNLQPDLTIFDKSGNGSSYHSAWNSFRVIALGFVVVAALIMVITQAAGLEVLDAYTVRKVLPRLLASAVFITISWDVLEVFFRLSDAATIGLRSLIYAPFTTLDPVQLGGGSAFSGLLLGGGALIAMGWIALLSFGLSALLAVALAFFILVLIKVALAGILIASPIFIAASILPGTSKLYEFGKGALISLLLAPVVVGALIALFRTGAVIAYNREDGNAAINQIIAILLYFGAYFAILKGLSAVGGFAATITGFVNDRGRGAFDRLKKFRGDKVKQNMADMRTGERFGEKTRFGRTLNRIGQNAMQVGDAGFGITRGSRLKHAGLRDVRGRAAGERAMKSEDMQALQYDDDGIAAMYLSGGRSARRARSELRRIHTNPDGTWHEGWNEQRVEKAVSTAQAVGITRSNAIAAGTLGAKNKFRSIGAGQDGIDTIDATARYIAGGDDQLAANLRDGIKYHARVSGRTDLAANDMDSSWGRTDIGELGRSTPAAVRAHMEHMSAQYRLGNQGAIAARMQQQHPQRTAAEIANMSHQEAVQDRVRVAQYLAQQRAQQDVERVRNGQAALGPLQGAELDTAAARYIADQNARGSIKLLEAHTAMSQGINADAQVEINRELTSLGYNGVQRGAGTVEDYLARNSGGTFVNGQALRTVARTWDSPDPSQGQGRAAPPVGVGVAPPGGGPGPAGGPGGPGGNVGGRTGQAGP